MLGEDYPCLLARVMSAIEWKIELPPDQEGFFDESGPTPSYDNDMRRAVRTRIRTRGLLFWESGYPPMDRVVKPIAIYTKDFAQTLR